MTIQTSPSKGTRTGDARQAIEIQGICDFPEALLRFCEVIKPPFETWSLDLG